MTEVVINTCFGGFGLSPLAQQRILELKGITVYPYESDLFDDTYYRISGISGFVKKSLSHVIYWFLEDPKVEKFTVDKFKDPQWKMYPFKDFSYEDKRSDAELIQAVKELGEEANGQFAELEIVTIPDGYDYKISDYDGSETVYAGQHLISIP